MNTAINTVGYSVRPTYRKTVLADMVSVKIIESDSARELEDLINDFMHNSENIKVLKGMMNVVFVPKSVDISNASHIGLPSNLPGKMLYTYTIFYTQNI